MQKLILQEGAFLLISDIRYWNLSKKMSIIIIGVDYSHEGFLGILAFR
jgi:hypothetical protein